jgi:CAAX prenyl protease-like protein
MTAKANDRPEPERSSSLRPPLIRDDLAYLLPMATFLVFTQLSSWWPKYYPALYTAKTVVVAGMLVVLWRHYTKIRWNYWWLGLIFGVIGIFQWVPMQLWLQQHFEFFRPSDPDKVFNPLRDIASPQLRWAFIGVRLAGAVLVVPVMEELFWRDFLWRQVIAPNDFKLAEVGEWDWKAFLAVSALFAVVHGNWWLTSIVWAMLAGLLLVMTRSLGACIVMHATTNLLLGAYVLRWQDWAFW